MYAFAFATTAQHDPYKRVKKLTADVVAARQHYQELSTKQKPLEDRVLAWLELEVAKHTLRKALDEISGGSEKHR